MSIPEIFINRNFISVDIETVGPCPGRNDIIEIGAVWIGGSIWNLGRYIPEQEPTFHVLIRPTKYTLYDKRTMSSMGWTIDGIKKRERQVSMKRGMFMFYEWIQHKVISTSNRNRVRLVSDNPAFDGGFLNWAFRTYVGLNPFGHSAISISHLYKGIMKDFDADFRGLRDTPHDHNALHDAMGNAEAFIKIMRMIYER